MIRLALVGLGRMGSKWLRAIRASERFDLVAVVDPVAPDADVTDIDGAPPFDAAIIATPTPLHHYGIVKNEAFICGRGVLVEKPLAATYDDACAMTALAEDYRVPLVVGHVERFNPAVCALFDVVQSGALGDVLHVEAIRRGPRPEPVAPGNGVALDLSVHDLDLVRRLLGPLRVADATEDDGSVDIHVVSARFPAGGAASCYASWWDGPRARSLFVTGSRACCAADLLAKTCRIVKGGRTVRDVEVPAVDALAAQLDAFATLIETGDPGALCSAEDGAEAVRLVEEAAAMGARRAA